MVATGVVALSVTALSQSALVTLSIGDGGGGRCHAGAACDGVVGCAGVIMPLPPPPLHEPRLSVEPNSCATTPCFDVGVGACTDKPAGTIAGPVLAPLSLATNTRARASATLHTGLPLGMHTDAAPLSLASRAATASWTCSTDGPAVLWSVWVGSGSETAGDSAAHNAAGGWCAAAQWCDAIGAGRVVMTALVRCAPCAVKRT